MDSIQLYSQNESYTNSVLWTRLNSILCFGKLAGAVIGSWSWQISCTVAGSDTTTRASCDCRKMLNFNANHQYEYFTSEIGGTTPELEGNYTVRYESVDFFGGRVDIPRIGGFPCSMKIEMDDNNTLKMYDNCNETNMTECAWHVYQRRIGVL